MNPITPSERTGSNVRLLLARKRLTQTDLARALGMTQPQVSKRLTGRVAFDVDELIATADFLDVSVVELLPDKATA